MARKTGVGLSRDDVNFLLIRPRLAISFRDGIPSFSQHGTGSIAFASSHTYWPQFTQQHCEQFCVNCSDSFDHFLIRYLFKESAP